MLRLTVLIAAAALLLMGTPSMAADPAPGPEKQTPAEAVTLPKDIVWETNMDDPPIGSPKALRGGRLTVAEYSYPLTFRTLGPNSNDYFAAWNRAFTLNFTLVTQHPVTDRFIPLMATHWSVQKDQKTIYLKLDRDARWSDGHPITADDYVFTLKMMKSKFILDPFYNTYAEQFYQSIDKIDDYTLRIVGTRPSWKPLDDYARIWPTPAHATVLDKDWVNRTTNQPQIAIGPYTISNVERGVSITFKRDPNWWGNEKRYLKGLYNFDEIHLRIITPERERDYLRLGELDMMVESSVKNWHEGYDFPAVKNGWLRRIRDFVDWPDGISGLQMNLEAPIFQNRDFRVAMQYLFNFERLNRNMWYSEYFRPKSFFAGTPYADPDIKAYDFNPAKAKEYLARAGYHPPKITAANHGFFERAADIVSGLVFPRTDSDDILVNDRGEKASFTLLYYSKTLEADLTVMQQDFRRAGVDMRLQLLDPGTMFERALERKFEMFIVRMTSGLYPDPRQYLHTDFKNSKNNNDFWGFGTKEVDDLIKTYDENLDPEARMQAMHRIDQIVNEEAFYIHFRSTPYLRLAYWDYLQFPDTYLPRRTEQVTDYMVYWIDPEKKAALAEAMRTGKAYPLDPNMDKDPYDVRKKFQ